MELITYTCTWYRDTAIQTKLLKKSAITELIIITYMSYVYAERCSVWKKISYSLRSFKGELCNILVHVRYIWPTSMWLSPDCWDEHFLFYNISQNINSLKDILQILWTLLGPLFKGPAPWAWCHKKGPVIFYISCSTTDQKFLTVLEISVQVIFRGRTCNSLKDHTGTKWKVHIV